MTDEQKKDLLEYLKNAIALESDLIKQQNISDDFQAKVLSLKPVYHRLRYPSKPQLTETHIGTGLILSIVLLPFTIVFFIAALWIGDSGAFMGGIMAILCAGTAIYIGYYGVTALMVTINDTSIKKREEKEYPQQIERYNKECRNVDETNESNLKKYNSDLECWNKSRAESMSVIDSHYQNTKRLLFALYKKGVIYEKYQTLPALTSIYEYFLTGRCEELSGAHGAYNVYEDEVRKDTVISQLNAVIENLEQIKQNQYMLYQTVKEIQGETAAIASDIHQMKGYVFEIKELTALNVYYSALTARNTHVSMLYHI